MDKREKAIKGLEYCVAPARKGWPYKPNIAEAGCELYDCPYSDNCEDMLFDALELLKAQEPHCLTLEELRKVEPGTAKSKHGAMCPAS